MSKSFIIKIWVSLLVMLGVSIALGEMHNPLAATVLVFGVAIIKAGLVIYYYMGLKIEPRYVSLAMLAGVAAMFILYFALVPDIVHVYGQP